MSKDKNNDNIKSEAPAIMKIVMIGTMIVAMLLGHHILFKDNPEPHQKVNQSQQPTR